MRDHGPGREPEIPSTAAIAGKAGAPIEMEGGDPLLTPNAEEKVGIASPTSWWRLGIAAIVVIAALILLMQFLTSARTEPDTGAASTPAAAQQ
jgi:hypothetical protein